MATQKVQDVMTGTVVVARPDTGYKELVDILTHYQVSALPVVDDDGRVIGVVSEADLLHKLEFDPHHAHRRLFERRRRGNPPKADADSAAELMTSPALTIPPTATVGEAARRMEHHNVKRLPVVATDNRLIGIVSRRDLLRTYLRTDPDIRRDVLNQVVRQILLDQPAQVDVAVVDGVVTLRGTVDRRSSGQIAVRLTHAITGVVDVVDELKWERDDTNEIHKRYLFDAQIPPTIRWP
jgi:CBS domain-containing protein